MVLDPSITLPVAAIGGFIAAVIGLVYGFHRARVKLESRIATLERAEEDLSKRMDRMEERLRKDIDRLADTILSIIREAQKGTGSR